MDRRNFIKTAGTGAVAGVAATTLATPAITQSRIPLVIVSSWPRDFPGLGTGAQRLAARIERLTEGRFDVQYFAAGERVGAFDAFDAVASGDAQAYHSADYYWKGKHPGWAYFTSVPFGLTYTEHAAWLNWRDGQQLWDELAAEFGLKCLAPGNTGVQMGGWFNKEINSAEDLKGLKMRIPGLGGDVMAKLGASPVSLPGGQIYENLVSGAIDATEWVGPWNDYFMKFYEAAKYYYYPGMHEPGGPQSFGMNKSWWESLSATDQEIIKAACEAEFLNLMAEFNANNGRYLTKLIDEHGVQLRKFNDDVYDAFGSAAEAVFEETRQHSDLANRIHESFVAARADVGRWMNLSDAAYYAQRNRVLKMAG
ncbi:C4-dicarboxylate ABC transporter [Thalassobaculum fulvum]|jgi:TRAP-type mannitol/chloroaromatic compound transport system substrate-binding protein|uniref:C4-dicarboxylate ABC transporter n=1 Tax=Thalassobaculum fulvum TaxID=1633335 RepID=A0A919CRR3_9PROT|nr:TRAP transporter substrate-binding protein [Thalassobaculum fulvum]GHD59168.1 C4-dicarboxylate ABC transporter [Thalassobaculum fulvum]